MKPRQTITLSVTNDAVYELTENFNVNLAQPGECDHLGRPGRGHDHRQRRDAGVLDQRHDGQRVCGHDHLHGDQDGIDRPGLLGALRRGSRSAVTPGDYTAGTSALSGDLSFAAGVTTQTITLNVTSDQVQELTENFNVNLSAAVHATISDAQGVGTITDDDAAPSFAINDVTVNEADGTITFTVTKTGLTTLASSVDFSVAPNTAVTPGTTAARSRAR